MYHLRVPRRRPIVILFVPVPIILLVCLLEALGLTARAGARIYDLFLRLEPGPPIARELLLVDIDDRAIAVAGAWPWSRDVLADGLLVMKELEARYAVFDTPFSGRAPPGVDRHILREELPLQVSGEIDRIQENVRSLFDAIRRGSIRPADSPRYVAELVGLIAAGKTRLLDAVARVERDSDEYLGQALRLFEGSFLAVELDTSLGASPPSTAELLPLEHFVLPNVSAAGLPLLWARGLFLPAPSVGEGARGGGFREVVVDPDGVVRRARLLASYRDRAVGQVAFAALLERMGKPAVSVSADSILLSWEVAPSSPSRELDIPLTPEGELLIDWPHARGGSLLRRLSWLDLYQNVQLEADLVAALQEMDRTGYLTYYRSDPPLLDLYASSVTMRSEILSSGDTSRLAEWRDARARFFALADALLNGDVEQRIVSDAERSLSMEGPTDEEKAAIRATRERAPELFRKAREHLAGLVRIRQSLREALSNSFCVVSVTGTSATVLGETPLGRPTTTGYASAALANALLTGRFFRSVPRWYSVVAAGVLSLLLAATLLRARPARSLVAGVAAAVGLCAAALAVLVFARIVVDPTAPAGCALLVGSAIAAVKARQDRVERSDW